MNWQTTAFIFVGYQNDYFAENGIFRGVIEEPARASNVLANTLALIERLKSTPAQLISMPIVFTPDYAELVEPVGIFKAIKEAGAFRHGTEGGETIREFQAYGERILEIKENSRPNAFSDTRLHETLQERGATDVYLAGAVTSISIDSMGRAAFENGYNVHILSDCTAGRTPIEQTFYCDTMFPLCAEVVDNATLLKRGGLDDG